MSMNLIDCWDLLESLLTPIGVERKRLVQCKLKTKLESHKPISVSFSRRMREVVVELAKEAIAAVIALLLVGISLSFVYLYCLPWLGTH